MMSPRLKLLIPALTFAVAGGAQENGYFNYSSVGFQFYSGGSIGNTFQRIKTSRPFTGEIYYQRQFNPSPTWNYTKRLPQWGIGVSVTNSGSEYVGSIVGLYPFIRFPLLTAGPYESNLRFGFGLGCVQRPYEEVANPENELLSQKFNTLANIVWQNEFRLSSRHFLNTAVMFYHVSNAKTNLPNLGINIPSISLGYRYAFNGETKRPVMVHDSVNKKIYFQAIVSGGVKQMQMPDSSYYFVKLLTGELSKQVSYSSILSLGLFITHDASVKTDTLITRRGSVNTSQLALYASYEYNFGRVTIPVQFGVFLYNSNSKILESIGLRYKITDRLLGQFMLKAHGHKADLMHFGIGYRFR